MTLRSKLCNVEGVNVSNEGTLDEWMSPHPCTYMASWDLWYYKIKLDQYFSSINKLVLMGVMKSLVYP